jgi:hypothetical protein
MEHNAQSCTIHIHLRNYMPSYLTVGPEEVETRDM